MKVIIYPTLEQIKEQISLLSWYYYIY
jgi:hypothetical protein